MRHEYNIGQIYGMKRLEMLMPKDGRTVAGVYFCISPSGEYIEFENANQFDYNNSLNPARVRAAANNFRSYKGYKFGFVKFLQDLEPQSTIENAVLPQRVEYENGETPFSEAPSIER